MWTGCTYFAHEEQSSDHELLLALVGFQMSCFIQGYNAERVLYIHLRYRL
jgi:hypothetical protein